MNEKIAQIMRDSGCTECGAERERDVKVQRFGGGDNYIIWRCTNPDCEKSKQWNRCERKRKY